MKKKSKYFKYARDVVKNLMYIDNFIQHFVQKYRLHHQKFGDLLMIFLVVREKVQASFKTVSDLLETKTKPEQEKAILKDVIEVSCTCKSRIKEEMEKIRDSFSKDDQLIVDNFFNFVFQLPLQ